MPLELASPESLGFVPERLARVEAAIANDIEEGLCDGAALAVGRRGALALLSVQGFSQRSIGRKLREDDVLVTFSSGKQFTVAAVLSFVERGALQLHRPVAEVIPEFSTNGKRSITLAHLLTHTSGIPAFPPPLPPEHMADLQKTVAAICTVAPETLPGKSVKYSIIAGHAVMAEMVRRADGGARPFRDIVRDEIFAPLGMRDTALGLPERLKPRLVPVVVRDRAPGLLDPDMLESMSRVLT